MAGIEGRLENIGRLDALARRDSPIHAVDPRVKIVVAFAYVLVVTSYGRYATAELIPLALFPVLAAAIAEVPGRFLASRLLIASPFAVFVGVFNPLIDREIVATVAGIGVSGGWLSFFSILLRYVLSMSAALVLVATTGFYTICSALGRLKVPSVLTVQLLLLYRYLFLLTEEAIRLVRARRLRSFGKRGEGLASGAALITSLLSRTLARACRIHEAMAARGMLLTLPPLSRTKMTPKDRIILLASLVLLALLRSFDFTGRLGAMVTGGPS